MAQGGFNQSSTRSQIDQNVQLDTRIFDSGINALMTAAQIKQRQNEANAQSFNAGLEVAARFKQLDIMQQQAGAECARKKAEDDEKNRMAMEKTAGANYLAAQNELIKNGGDESKLAPEFQQVLQSPTHQVYAQQYFTNSYDKANESLGQTINTQAANTNNQFFDSNFSSAIQKHVSTGGAMPGVGDLLNYRRTGVLMLNGQEVYKFGGKIDDFNSYNPRIQSAIIDDLEKRNTDLPNSLIKTEDVKKAPLTTNKQIFDNASANLTVKSQANDLAIQEKTMPAEIAKAYLGNEQTNANIQGTNASTASTLTNIQQTQIENQKLLNENLNGKPITIDQANQQWKSFAEVGSYPADIENSIRQNAGQYGNQILGMGIDDAVRLSGLGNPEKISKNPSTYGKFTSAYSKYQNLLKSGEDLDSGIPRIVKSIAGEDKQAAQQISTFLYGYHNNLQKDPNYSTGMRNLRNISTYWRVNYPYYATGQSPILQANPSATRPTQTPQSVSQPQTKPMSSGNIKSDYLRSGILPSN